MAATDNDAALIALLRARPYFFDRGLRFACQQCGACCTGASGTVYVSSEELVAIASFLHLPEGRFVREYLYPFRDSFSIHEDAQGRCVFFQDGCLIYEVRPRQCRTYPFWFHNLRSEENWREAARQCPGVGKGRYYAKEEIFAFLEELAP